MAYDFPAGPSENDEYTPPIGGQTYVYKSPKWLVKGIPPVGSGGTGGIGEAPEDGKQYAREDADWSEVIIPATDWASIPGKPDTFPPTVPIPWTDVSGKPATFPPTVPIPWTDVSGKPATFPPTLPIAQADVTGLVAGQSAQDTAIAGKAPTVHTHAQADVTGLVAGQAAQDTAITGKVAKGGDTMTGLLVLSADPAAALGAATKQYVDNKVAAATPLFSISDTAPSTPVHGQGWWNSSNGNLFIYYNDGTSSQWVQINNTGAL